MTTSSSTTRQSRSSSSTSTTPGSWTKYEELGQCCANMKLDSEADSALHMVIKAFLEGEMLANTAEANNPQNLEMHTSAPELWGLLK